jgi:serine/threonine protein phosphatase PrpC
VRAARLFGRDHHVVGSLAAIAEGPVAITLSRGGARKTYDHTEPNEDAVLFAHDRGGTLVAVTDGHHGAAGSQLVIEHIESEWARRWTGELPIAVVEGAWRNEAERMLVAANHALLADAGRRGLPPAPTTLALIVVRPQEGLAFWAGIGDSHVFAIDAGRARDLLGEQLAGRRPSFLGYESLDTNSLAERAASGTIALAGLAALVLATDGLSESGIGVPDPADAVHRAVAASRVFEPELRPLELARRVGDAALAAHRSNRAGDNIASAVIWLADQGAS